MAPIGEPIAPLTAPDHLVTPLGRSELVGLIGQPPLRHTHCAVAVWAHPEARLGPLAGHYARRMPGIQGQLRAVPDDSSPACRRSGRDLPSWSCEFDSCHPLHGESARRRLLIDADSNSTKALLQTSGDLRATARWFRTHTRSDRACPTRGGVLSRSHKSQKSFIVSVLSPGAPASPRQPWTPHRTDIPVAFSAPNVQDEANRPSSSRADHHRCQPERVHTAAESSPRTPLGHAPIPALLSTQQLIPRQSALEELRTSRESTPAAGRPSTAPLQRSCRQGLRCLRVVAWLKSREGQGDPICCLLEHVMHLTSKRADIPSS